MRRLLFCAIAAAVSLVPWNAWAQSHDPPAPAPATQPILDEPALGLVHRLQEAEARTGFRRMHRDEEGKIRTIFLSSANATDENLRGAAHLPDLNYIKINYSWSGISADALGELRLLDHLDKLELRYANRQITPEYGMAISKISSLKALTISSSDIDLKVIGFLSALPKLTSLDLRSCREFTDGNAVALTQLRQLESLDLSYTAITPAALDVLATLPRLRQLTITGTSITENDVLQSKLVGKVVVKGAKVKVVENPSAS